MTESFSNRPDPACEDADAGSGEEGLESRKSMET